MLALMQVFFIVKSCVTLLSHLSRLLRDHRVIILQLVSLRGLRLCSREEGLDRLSIAVGAIVGPGALRMTTNSLSLLSVRSIGSMPAQVALMARLSMTSCAARPGSSDDTGSLLRVIISFLYPRMHAKGALMQQEKGFPSFCGTRMLCCAFLRRHVSFIVSCTLPRPLQFPLQE